MKIESTYRGKALSEYSKEELIKIVEELGNMYNKALQDHIKDINMLRS